MNHIILTLEKALADLPLLLSNPSKTPENTTDNPGSKNYGARPRIIAIGGGHSEDDFREMKSACKDVEKGIVWVSNTHESSHGDRVTYVPQLKKDFSRFTQKPDFSGLIAYGAMTAQQMKRQLDAMGLDKPENSDVEGVYYFSD